MMKFSIIVVALNPGEKLRKTIDSVLCQTFRDYEIVVKDGGSRDGSLKNLPEDSRIRLVEEPDGGIYEAMNQAVQRAEGEYLLFLNCGDVLYDREVLARAAACIDREKDDRLLVVYGDTHGAKNDVLISSPRRIDGFACYRNIPCHQSCFYEAKLCKEKSYNPEYRIRADYDHFLWCYYQAKAKMVHMGGTVSSYEGGGYSESKENRRRDKEEHTKITEEYMPSGELRKYRMAMFLTMAHFRSFLAENRLTSGIYHWLKDCFYHHRIRIMIGFVLFWVELALFLGTGVMCEDVTSFHTGEGAWQETQEDGNNVFRQEFVPKYDNLQMVSFLMYKENVTMQDGMVTLLVTDGQERVLCEKALGFDEVTDGGFTDVEVGLKVSPGHTYYLSVVTTPSSAGEYPTVGVCSKSYYLPENRALVHEEDMADTQMVSRYHYQDAIPFSKVCKIVLLCLVTALGVMFGLPDNRVLRRVAGIILLVAVPCVLGSRLELLTYNDTIYLPMALKWNIGLMFLLELVVLLCTHSPGISMVLTNIALTLVYSANYFMIMYRGTSLRVNDFFAIATAADVVNNYSFMPNDHLAFVWGILVLFVVYGIQTVNLGQRKQRKNTKENRRYLIRKVLTYVVTIAVGIGIIAYGGHKLFYTDYLNQKGFADADLIGFDYEYIYSFNGYLVATCIDVKNSRVAVPEGYSAEYAEQILTEAEGIEQNAPVDVLPQEELAELPHVILIMNESFADLSILGDLGLNQENMLFFNSLRENTVRGYVNGSVLGGGTANSEFEVFTGCSVAFFPVNYYPYQQGLKKPVNSLVSQMERYGYTTYSMHPENPINWNRIRIYEYYGFDHSFWKSDFEGAEILHSGVSDAETYQRVIELFEEREAGERQFIFDVTMQNHGDYPGEKGPYEIQSARMNNPSIDEYLTLIKRSDEAFADLIKYFEGQDEKVVVCMFGDHQPWLSSLITGTDRTGAGGQDGIQKMNMYKTPFVIWANYDIEEADGYDISMNYLGGLLQRTVGIPLSPYFVFLEHLMGEYPIITLNGYVDEQGNYSNWGSGKDEFLEYRILQHNYLFDDNTVEWGF